jgi:hypothetical protein
MQILFEARGCGLGNNGGTQTIIKSVEALNELGHEADIIAYVDRFSWFKHKRPIKKIEKGYDAHIAVSNNDVKFVMASNISKKMWWVRGHETWTNSEKKILQTYCTPGLQIMTNSHWIKDFMERKTNKEVEILYQGVDIFDWYSEDRERNERVKIGCLYGSKKSKRFTDFVELAHILPRDQYEFVAYGATDFKADFLSQKLINPNKPTLRKFYNGCDIWFAPTVLEGMHNPPMEAALCNCVIVCSDNPKNGMPYATRDTAMIYSSIHHAANLIRDPKWYLVYDMRDMIVNEIGSRKHNMEKLVAMI